MEHRHKIGQTRNHDITKIFLCNCITASTLPVFCRAAYNQHCQQSAEKELTKGLYCSTYTDWTHLHCIQNTHTRRKCRLPYEMSMLQIKVWGKLMKNREGQLLEGWRNNPKTMVQMVQNHVFLSNSPDHSFSDHLNNQQYSDKFPVQIPLYYLVFQLQYF